MRSNLERRHAASAVRSGLYVLPSRAIPRFEHAPAGRTLHLVDIENLMGGPRRGRAAHSAAVADYREAAGVQPFDHLIIAANHAIAVDAGVACPGARLLAAGGRDGADLALLAQVADVRRTASLYDRVVVGSGDGIFADMLRALRSFGIAVRVVSRQRSLSLSLARVASFVRYVPEPTVPLLQLVS
jgi:hypothetical protein